MKLFDYFLGGQYKRCARFVPAVITLIPFVVVFVIFFVRGNLNVIKWLDALAQGWIGPVFKTGVIIVIVYCWGALVRLMAKWVEGIVYDEERGFPTTKLLLLRDDVLPRSEKEKIRSKLSREFSIDLLNLDEELENPKEAKDLIATAVKGVRDKLRGSEIVLHYNIGYGFVRNLTIGSAPALIASLVVAYAGYLSGVSSNLFGVGVFMSFFYGIMILLAKPLWTWSGNLYAKNLLREYLTSK